MKRVVKILLIEDDELSEIEVRRFLLKRGIIYSMNVARNGEDALSILERTGGSRHDGAPDIILLDLKMPRMNGLEFLEHLKKRTFAVEPKIFVLTTSDDARDKARAKLAGVAGFITKPLSLDTSSSSKDALNLMIDLMNL